MNTKLLKKCTDLKADFDLGYDGYRHLSLLHKMGYLLDVLRALETDESKHLINVLQISYVSYFQTVPNNWD